MNTLRMIKSPISFFLLIMLIVFWLLLYSINPTGNYKTRTRVLADQSNSGSRKLVKVLRAASTPGRAVILTILDKSWARPGSILDLFLESFRIGKGIKHLLNHLVIVALDSQALRYCKTIHRHCFHLKTTGSRRVTGKPFKNLNHTTFNQIIRLQFLKEVLEFGYNVVYTDADVMWVRSPLQLFDAAFEITIGCDPHSSGQSSKASGGFFHMRSDEISLGYLNMWNLDRTLFPNKANNSLCQIVGDGLAEHVGLRVKYIKSVHYGGFCQPSRDLSKIYVIHANCCDDMDSKIHDLKLVLDDIRNSKALFAKGSSLVQFSSSRRAFKCLAI